MVFRGRSRRLTLSSTTLRKLPTPGIEAAPASRIFYLFNRLCVLFHFLNEIRGGGFPLRAPLLHFFKKKKKKLLGRRLSRDLSILGLGVLTYVLVIDVAHSKERIFNSQHRLIFDLLEETDRMA